MRIPRRRGGVARARPVRVERHVRAFRLGTGRVACFARFGIGEGSGLIYCLVYWRPHLGTFFELQSVKNC